MFRTKKRTNYMDDFLAVVLLKEHVVGYLLEMLVTL